jgi:hypothetical protein
MWSSGSVTVSLDNCDSATAHKTAKMARKYKGKKLPITVGRTSLQSTSQLDRVAGQIKRFHL